MTSDETKAQAEDSAAEHEDVVAEQSAVDLPDREVLTYIGGPRWPPLPIEPPYFEPPTSPPITPEGS